MEVTSRYAEPDPPERLPPVAALDFDDVFRIFRSGPVETVALRGLTLRVEPAEVVAVYGPSGSGKSTFMHLAAGLDSPSAGSVRAFDHRLANLDDGALAEYRATSVAIVFQRQNLWPRLSARENVEVTLGLARRSEARGVAVRALDAFGLHERIDVRAGALSGGEQQRVAIAAAAAREAPLVLADEPTGELDARNEQVVVDALRALRDRYGATVVIVTHSPRLADHVDRVIELRDGRVVS